MSLSVHVTKKGVRKGLTGGEGGLERVRTLTHIQQWLDFLRAHHPTFSNPDIQIDDEQIQQLPEDGLVHDQLLNLTTSEIDSEEHQGPPEEGDDQPHVNLHSNGFVPDLHILTHEIDQL